MRNFNTIELKKFQDTSNYQLIEEGIYNNLNDIDRFSRYRIAIVLKIEKEKSSQQTIDEVLESYFVHIEETLGFEENNMQKYILGGELEDLKKFRALQKVTQQHKK
jgi:uncharacterized protein (UPF0216 family)